MKKMKKIPWLWLPPSPALLNMQNRRKKQSRMAGVDRRSRKRLAVEATYKKKERTSRLPPLTNLFLDLLIWKYNIN